MPEVFSEIPLAEFMAGKPVTDEKLAALYENPIAIAAGVGGARRVQGRALGGIVLPRFTVPSSGEGGLTDLDGVGTLLGWVAIADPASRIWRVRFSNDNGVSYGSWQTLTTLVSGTGLTIAHQILLNLQTGAFRLIPADSVDFAAGTLTVPTSANAFQLSFSANGTNIVSADFFVIGGIE